LDLENQEKPLVKDNVSAQVINGQQIAKSIRNHIRLQVKKLDFKPGLAVIQIGTDSASTVYVNHKKKDCERVGFHSKVTRLPSNTSQEEVIDLVKQLNRSNSIHGILVQMPMPSHINEQMVIDSILPQKDADGLGTVNLGNLLIGREHILPCTPGGILRLIEKTKVKLVGKRVVCVGRSRLVGKPIGLLLLNRHATVTFCHSRTTNLGLETKEADILVVAVGKPKFITEEMVKPEAIVIDVGINRAGDSLIGDIDFKAVSKVASFITPVPGGVGPMTRAILLENTLKLATTQS
tara:strand:+ start:1695 stop:2573 length:879 start_codon:yes stop_codon:yes gene_type:complete